MLEIEKRGFLTEEQYKNLLDFLQENGEDLGEDNKDVVYYGFSDKILKVVNNISKGNAKISLKLNKLGQGSVFPETEVHFAQDDFKKMKLIIEKITVPDLAMSGTQKRRNFNYKGCELSVKWSEEWKYHFEIEKLIDSEDRVAEAEKQLELVAEELGLKIMTEQELKDFTKKIESTYCNKK